MRQAAGDHRVGEPLAGGDADAPVVEKGALAALGDEHLVGGRIVDQAGDDRALALERDRDGELRDAVQEIRGAVERIDDPAVGLVGAFARAAFLAEKAVAGPRLGQFLQERLLGAAVGGGDEIGRALERDLQILDLAEVALERARGLARGGDHDVEQSGAEHGCRRARKSGVPSSAVRRRTRLALRGSVKPARQQSRCGGRSRATSWPPSRRRRAPRASAWRRRASSSGSLAPAALAMMCHLIASAGSAGRPRPAIRMRASRFCAIGLPRCAALQEQPRGAGFVLRHAGAVEQRDGVFDHGVEIAGDRGEPHQAHGLRMSFGTPRPSLYIVASAYCASGLPASAAARNNSAARLKSCGNCWPCR